MIKNNSNSVITKYNKSQRKDYAKMCDTLMSEIDSALSKSTSKIYHSNPVWFIDDNPIVGYTATAQSVNLLFWSGQSFDEPELLPIGKSKAAQVKYQKPEDVNLKSLKRWLKKSKEIMWNYKDIVKNKGKLSLLTKK